MSRESTGLENPNYDSFLSEKGKGSREARKELQQRRLERKMAHDGEGVGWHFGLGDRPVRVRSREEFRQELDKRGLMLEIDVKRNLR